MKPASRQPRKRGRPPGAKSNVISLPIPPKSATEPPPESVPPAAAQAKPKGKAKCGAKGWEPTEVERKLVEVCAAAGMAQHQIALVLGKSLNSLKRKCREEMSTGLAKINAKLAQTLIGKALAGDTVALIFLAKTRLGWNERQLHEITGRDGGPVVYEKQRADADAFTARIAAMGARQEAAPAEAGLTAPAPHQIN